MTTPSNCGLTKKMTSAALFTKGQLAGPYSLLGLIFTHRAIDVDIQKKAHPGNL